MLNFGIVAPFDFGQDLKASRCTSIRMHMNTHSLALSICSTMTEGVHY